MVARTAMAATMTNSSPEANNLIADPSHPGSCEATGSMSLAEKLALYLDSAVPCSILTLSHTMDLLIVTLSFVEDILDGKAAIGQQRHWPSRRDEMALRRGQSSSDIDDIEPCGLRDRSWFTTRVVSSPKDRSATKHMTWNNLLCSSASISGDSSQTRI